jgi:hypothetical protein
METNQQQGGTTTDRGTTNTPNSGGRTAGSQETQNTGLADRAPGGEHRSDRILQARTLIDEAEKTLRQARESYNALGMFDAAKSLDKIVNDCDRIGRAD